jgi:hypothetical protein
MVDFRNSNDIFKNAAFPYSIEFYRYRNYTALFYMLIYRVFGAKADCTFILPSEFSAKELRHLQRKMPPHGTTY